MDGGPLPPRTGREMCEYVVETGLYQGKPEELWNYSQTGELSCVFDLYYMALAVRGHKMAMELPDGQQLPLFGNVIPRPVA